MPDTAIHELDRAALALLQALAAHGGELRPYLEPDHLEALQQEVINLRRALLGLEMGPLYWETPPEFLEELVRTDSLPVQAAAARAAERLNPRQSGEGG